MQTFYRPKAAVAAPVAPSDLLRRKPQRISATLPWHLVQTLQERAAYEGRSLSGLISHILEVAATG